VLYGEGESAFIRLQEEIMKDSDDQSLFAWGVNYGSYNVPRLYGPGLLANSPALFAGSASVVPFRNPIVAPYAVTNKGIRMELHVVERDEGQSGWNENGLQACLDCHYENDYFNTLSIPLKHLGGYQYGRMNIYNLKKVESSMLSAGLKKKLVFISKLKWERESKDQAVVFLIARPKK
jgi:hypothetical protein